MDENTLEPRLVTKTAEPLPPLVDTPEVLGTLSQQIRQGTGCVGLDTERAGSFRYFQGAYLVQLRTAQTGTFLLDPTAFEDFTSLNDAIGKREWILHDATQDMPCLAELGMFPQALFDTAVAARLLNLDTFSLVGLLEHFLNVTLEKKHATADWSTRPLRQEWLDYAALDVEFLISLRERMREQLLSEGKDDWAHQEFEHLLGFHAPPEKPDPWRHVPGSGKVQSPRNLAALRELWQAREEIARRENQAPTKVMTNAAMIALATHLPTGKKYMNALADFRHDRHGRSRADTWFSALQRAAKLPSNKLPPRRAPKKSGEVPDARSFNHNHLPEAERWHRLRDTVTRSAEEADVNPEIMLEPKTVRQLAWVLPDGASESQVLEVLEASQARPWQIERLLKELTNTLRDK